jgi:hypothetical protein
VSVACLDSGRDEEHDMSHSCRTTCRNHCYVSVMAGTKLPPGWWLIDGGASLDDEQAHPWLGLRLRKLLLIRELTQAATRIELERQWQVTIGPAPR